MLRPLSVAVLIAGAAVPAAAQARDFAVSGFDRIDLHDVGDLTVTSGPRFSVRADGDPQLVERLTATVDGRTLDLRLQPDTHSEGHDGLRIAVTMPRLAAISIGGAGRARVDRVAGPNFAATIGGAGSIRLDRVEADTVTFDVGGSGDIAAVGRAGTLSATISGKGRIDATALAVRDATIEVSGLGHIAARASGQAAVDLSGMGGVEVTGGARCTVHRSGMGSVTCG